MKNLIILSILLVCSLFFVSNVSAQCQGNVYITSLSWQSANSVHGFTSTEVDFCAGLYYDPANYGSFIETYGTGTAILGTGYTQGFADSIPAELNFDSFAPVSNGAYTTSGNHYVIAYYQVYIPVYFGYYWYDPFGLGFSEIGGGDPFYYPDEYGYWGYASYWVSSPQYIGTTSNTIAYAGQTFCLPGQQFTATGQACSSLPGCESGIQFSSAGAVCPGYVPPAEPPSEIEVAVMFHDDELLPALIKGRPATNTKLTACLVNLLGNKSGFSVTLRLEDVSHDTGHVEMYHDGSRPTGSIGKSEGFTNGDGCFSTTYKPSVISGTARAYAKIVGATGEADVNIRVPNLARLLRGTNYRLNGSSQVEDCDAPQCTAEYMSAKWRKAHRDNHWVVPAAIPELKNVADDYRQQFYGSGYIPPDQMVTYNDASLRWGGKFDGKLHWLNKGWHGEHREGSNIDTKSQNIPSERVTAFRIIANRRNFGILHHIQKDPHFHFRWGEPTNNSTTTSTVLQSGIDPNMTASSSVTVTPSDLASNAAEALFERPITQNEFESWYPQLSNAKMQGPAVFLQEVKAFYQQLFASQEYVLLQRTDAQFVDDVFASHLLREPTDEEVSYWMNHLISLGGGIDEPIDPDLDLELGGKTRIVTPALSQSQRRQMFLSNFESTPQFAEMIAGVVNDTYAEPVQ